MTSSDAAIWAEIEKNRAATEQRLTEALTLCDPSARDASPEAKWKLLVALASLSQKIPAAIEKEAKQLAPKQSRGRPKTKTSQYDLGLLICRELKSREYGEPGSATRLAKELAMIEIETAAKREGRNLSSYSRNRNVAPRKKQIENDLSRLNKPGLRQAARIILDGALQGEPPSKIEVNLAVHLEKIAGSLSHKKSETS